MSRDQTLNGYGLTSPEFCGDFLGREQLIPGGGKFDPAALTLQEAMTVKLAAAADAADEELTVDALTADLAPGTMLNFGIPGMMAYAPVGAEEGAEAITVAPLDRAIPDNAEAQVAETTRKVLNAGTVIGRTFAERDAETPFGLAGDADDEIAIVAFDRIDVDRVNDVDMIRPFAGVIIKENFLPNFANLSAAVQAAVRARYNCTIGRP